MIPWEKHKKLWQYGLPKCRHARCHVVRVVQGTPERQRTVVRQQCLDCGCLDSGDGEPMRLKDHPDAPPCDETALAIWADMRITALRASRQENAKRHAMRVANRPAENAEWWSEYDAYRKTPKWQALRRRRLDIDHNRCTARLNGCTGHATEVHHDRYAGAYRYHRRLDGETPLWALRSVCHGCHAKITAADQAQDRIDGRPETKPSAPPKPIDCDPLDDLPF
jgi:hypothetical protein